MQEKKCSKCKKISKKSNKKLGKPGFFSYIYTVIIKIKVMTSTEKLQFVKDATEKAEKVVFSCETYSQLENATNFIKIVIDRIYDLFPILFGNSKFREDIRLTRNTVKYLESLLERQLNSLEKCND